MESTDLEHLPRPKLPRALSALIVGAIALAVLGSLAWSQLGRPLGAGPTEVGVIRRLVPDPDARPSIGSPAPVFEWNAPGGTTTRLDALRGKTVIVNFWATWCVPCREEMPALERAAAADPTVVVLAVDLLEDGRTVRAFFDSLSLVHLQPILDVDGEVARRYVVFTVPTTFFIAPDGIVRRIHIGGPMTPEVVAEAIAKSR